MKGIIESIMSSRLFGAIITFLLLVSMMSSCAEALPAPESNPPPSPTTPAPPQEEYDVMGKKYILPTHGELENERAGLVRNYPKVLKGVFEVGAPNGSRLIKEDLPELKALGVNTIWILPWYRDMGEPPIIIRGKTVARRALLAGTKLAGLEAEREYIDRVVRAKKAGFAVLIAPLYSDGTPQKISDLDAFDEFALNQAKRWANIAESYKVEYFAPFNEYERIISMQNLPKSEAIKRWNNWNKRALEEVRAFFRGKMIWKGTPQELNELDFSGAQGFDILSISFGLANFNKATPEDYRQTMQGYFDTVETAAKRGGVDWMLGEYFLYTTGRSEEELVKHFQVVFEEYQKRLKGEKRPVGFTFSPWDSPLPLGKLKNAGVVPLLKQFFQEIEPVN